MKRLFRIIGNLLAILIVGAVFAKLRFKAKYFYLVLIGAISICLGIGLGAMLLAVLGFEDVGGNLYRVLCKYSIVFGLCSIGVIYFLDRLIAFIQEYILNIQNNGPLSLFQGIYAFLTGVALICYFFLVPEILGTATVWALLIFSIVYGLKSKV